MYFVIGVVLLSFLLLYLIATSDLEVLHKFILVLIELGVAGLILKKIAKPTKNWWIDGEWGLILLKTKKGLKTIDKIAKDREIWNFIADVGLVAGYGVFSYFIMRKHFTWKKFILGMVLLTILSMFVVPYAIPFLMTTLKGQILSEATAEKNVYSGFMAWVGLVITYGFGLFGVVLSGIVQYGITILIKIVGVILGTGTITSDSAGVTLIIPGINIPLLEGIIALLIILVVHEGAHAILGRVAKVPLLSTGLVLFGTAPIGAFVEPDEKWLEKLEKRKQTRVLIAGPTANLLAAVLFFILFISFGYFSEDYKEHGMLVLEGMEYGTIVYSINGVDIGENTTLIPGEVALVQTNEGEIERIVNEEGKIGIQGYYLDGSLIVKYKEDWMNFVYITLGLIFSLNFVIGVVNLLPIPAFDGHRLIELNIDNKDVVRFITYVSILGLVMNFLPWLF